MISILFDFTQKYVKSAQCGNFGIFPHYKFFSWNWFTVKLFSESVNWTEFFKKILREKLSNYHTVEKWLQRTENSKGESGAHVKWMKSESNENSQSGHFKVSWKKIKIFRWLKNPQSEPYHDVTRNAEEWKWKKKNPSNWLTSRSTEKLKIEGNEKFPNWVQLTFHRKTLKSKSDLTHITAEEWKLLKFPKLVHNKCLQKQKEVKFARKVRENWNDHGQEVQKWLKRAKNSSLQKKQEAQKLVENDENLKAQKQKSKKVMLSRLKNQNFEE